MNVYDADGNKIDLDEALKATGATERCLPVQVRAQGEFIEGYVHACRLPPAKAAEARRRVRVAAKKKGRNVQARTLRLAGAARAGLANGSCKRYRSESTA